MTSEVEVIQMNGTGVGSDIGVSFDGVSYASSSKSHQSPAEAIGSLDPLPVDSEEEIPPADNEDDEMERQELILLISRYRNAKHVGKYLTSLKKRMSDSALEGMSREDLNTLLKQIRLQISCGNSSDFVSVGFAMGTCTIENLALSFTPFKLQGWSEMLKNHPSIPTILEEIQLEHSALFYTSPVNRLALVMIASAAQVHQTNSAAEELACIENMGQKKIDPAVQKKYGDL
jgi:hypothetical protein